MGTFFSGTDESELQDNTPNHKMYLSLIVNYQDGGNPIARLCYKGTERIFIYDFFKNKLFNKKGKKFTDDLFFEETYIYYIDLEIKFDISEKSIKRYQTLKNKVITPYYNTYNKQDRREEKWYRKNGNGWSKEKNKVKNRYDSQLSIFENDNDNYYGTTILSSTDDFDLPLETNSNNSTLIIDEFKISKFIAAILTLDFNLCTTTIIENNKIILKCLDELEDYKPEDIIDQVFENMDSLAEYFAEIIFEEEVDMEIDMPIILNASIKYLDKFVKSKKAIKCFETYNNYLLTVTNIIN